MKKLILITLMIAGSYCQAFANPDTVYVTKSGKKYHTSIKCRSLARSKVIYVRTNKTGLDACKLCNRKRKKVVSWNIDTLRIR